MLEDRFAVVPEWVLDADIGDCALRLYAVLLRYGNSTGDRMPARSTLAARLHKKSTDTVDRALTALVTLGAVQVEPRWSGRQRLTNRYRIRTSRPTGYGPTSPAASGSGPGGGRTNAATPVAADRGGRIDAATRTDRAGSGRTDRGRVAVRIVHDRECSTETTPPPPSPPPDASARSTAVGGGAGSSTRDCTRRPQGTGATTDSVGHWKRRHGALLADCGIHGAQAWDRYVAEIRTARRDAGQPLVRWSPAHLQAALDLAVRGRGWARRSRVVRALAVGDNGVFAAGGFTTVNGSPASGLAALDAVTGNVLWGADVTKPVWDLVAVGPLLYVAGNLDSINGVRRRGLAQLNALDGSVLPDWKPSVGGGYPRALALAPNGQDLVFGGNFDTVDGQPRPFLASVSLATAEVTSWAPPPACDRCRIWDLAADASSVYAGTAGPGGKLVAFDGETGERRWRIQADGDVQAVDAHDGMVYAGGHFSPDFGGETRYQLAAVDGASGAIDGYAPAFGTRAKPGIWAVSARLGALYVGGGFTRVGSTTQKRYAQIPVSSG